MFRTKGALTFVCLTIALLVCAQSTRLHAIEKRPLPEFTLFASDGSEVASDRLIRNGKWRLLYATRDCEPCDSILLGFARLEQASVASKLVIVVGGIRADALAGIAQKYPGLAAAVW